MKIFSAACLIATLAATSALAQTTPQGSPPGATAPGSPEPETKAERQRNSAAKLAGLLYFVQNACPDLQPDYTRFKDVVAGLGVSLDDLSAGDLLLRSRTYTEVYTKDTPANCARADTNFGPTGTTIPGLVVKRTTP
ncbi:hypothetical protein PMNALOAF_1199 [Methylobacterium adhaesivum]|jgi:hypothetical protein|uniref:Uncharacterized protein n=1 Tax=Methylobacterium adhaesivum TaxID=333297 RepID=A0ABT8BFN6_9HYPH|nr:hypothetical protein [Methylobacterium adhaesivum]MDN3590654.1 hypothetical protein [Methylobacterium adhaesivum]GJD29957.1 hypothetical protein PMNALOAF_1199 [Methylobacterium adhaesivum]